MLEPCRSTTPRTEDNSAQSCNSRFSNRDSDKEAKLTDCSFKSLLNINWNNIIVLSSKEPQMRAIAVCLMFTTWFPSSTISLSTFSTWRLRSSSARSVLLNNTRYYQWIYCLRHSMRLIMGVSPDKASSIQLVMWWEFCCNLTVVVIVHVFVLIVLFPL